MNDPRMYAQMAQMQDNEGAEGPQPTDEEMLETVRQGMGAGPGAVPPPGSGMRWENLQEDQQALMQNPAPENVQAFVQYWGEENLPPELQQMAMQGGEMPPMGGGGMY